MDEWDSVGVVPRIVRLNVLPVFLLALALTVWLVAGTVIEVRWRGFGSRLWLVT